MAHFSKHQVCEAVLTTAALLVGASWRDLTCQDDSTLAQFSHLPKSESNNIRKWTWWCRCTTLEALYCNPSHCCPNGLFIPTANLGTVCANSVSHHGETWLRSVNGLWQSWSRLGHVTCFDYEDFYPGTCYLPTPGRTGCLENAWNDDSGIWKPWYNVVQWSTMNPGSSLTFLGSGGLHLGAHLQQSSWAQAVGFGTPGHDQSDKLYILNSS